MKLLLCIISLYLGCLYHVFAEPAKACLYNCEDAIVLVLNKHHIDDTGAWIAFLSLGLEQGKGESYLGLDKVDYKIESGILSRYTASFGKKWTDLSQLESFQLGPWLALRIPKYHLLNPKAKLSWRVALFPKGKNTPTKLPTKGPATLNLYQNIGITSYRGYGLPLDICLAVTYQKKFNLPTFSSGDTFSIPSMRKDSLKHELNHSLDQLIEPIKNSLFVGGVHFGPKPISEEVAEGHRASHLAKAYVFDQPNLKNENLNAWLNQARSISTFLIESESFFIQNFSMTLPELATGAIYKWQGELQSMFEHIEQQRKANSGPMYYYYDPKQKKWDPKLFEASMKIWKKFDIHPMLMPKYSFENCSHELFTDVLWQKYCLMNFRQLQKKPEKLSKIKSIKLLAPEIYLRKVIETFTTHVSLPSK